MNEELFVSREFTPVDGLRPESRDPPVTQRAIYNAVNYEQQHTMAKSRLMVLQAFLLNCQRVASATGIPFRQ